jgi:hypothetical protein
MFLQRPEFSHLLFLDADVQLPAAGLARLLAADKPVIGAPVALKGAAPPAPASSTWASAWAKTAICC